MKILDGLFGSHLDNLTRAMNRTVERQGLVSANLANVDTPNYRRQDIDFGIELSTASNGKFGGRAKMSLGSKGVQRDLNGVNLEAEIVAMAETETRFKLLSDMTARYFTDLHSAIREGR